MIDESVLQRTLGAALRSGGDFAEVFVEDRRSSSAHLDDGRVEEVTSGRDRGAGIWNHVRLRSTGAAVLGDPRMDTRLPDLPDTSTAELTIVVPVRNGTQTGEWSHSGLRAYLMS